MMTIRHALIHDLAVHNPQLLPHSPVDLRTEPDRRTSLRSEVSLSFSAAAFLDRHCLGTGAGLVSAISAVSIHGAFRITGRALK
jgi:hypothetical protein